ncbi:MAG: hypothetical protein U5J63_06350 [Fodinibius sp.]|nr:hypothetical protein [Fodinibius sp.]
MDWPRLFNLPRSDRKSIAIETGIQNSGLGLLLIFNFFDGLGGMALVAAWWGIWHVVTGMAHRLVLVYRQVDNSTGVQQCVATTCGTSFSATAW